MHPDSGNAVKDMAPDHPDDLVDTGLKRVHGLQCRARAAQPIFPCATPDPSCIRFAELCLQRLAFTAKEGPQAIFHFKRIDAPARLLFIIVHIQYTVADRQCEDV